MEKSSAGIEFLQEPVTAISVIIPCKNEADAIGATVTQVRRTLEPLKLDFEVIVVDDGSTDDSRAKALEAGARVLVHPLSLGYGKALMNGMEISKYPLTAILDADGTYPISMLPTMIERAKSHDLVIGRRKFSNANSSVLGRVFRRALYYVILYLTNVKAPDYNSGLRIFRKTHTLPYRNLLCPTFSFTTSQTLIYLLCARSVAFVPIEYSKRIGRSKVAYFRDAFVTFSYVFLIANIFQAYRLSLIFIFGAVALNGLIVLAAAFAGLPGGVQLGLHLTISVSIILCLIALVVQPVAKLNMKTFSDEK